MAAISFPSSPALNDIHTVGNRSWKYNGTAWKLVPRTTDAVVEGSTNLYFTNARVASAPAVTALESRASAIESDITDIESAATTLAGRVTSAEGDIDSLESRASSLEGGLSTAESNISALDSGKQIKDVVSTTAPSHTAGLRWIDPTDFSEYLSYNGAWVELDKQ